MVKQEAHCNEYTKEWWRGDDRDAAADYVATAVRTCFNAPIEYTGRINGEWTDDQAALKKLRDQLLAEIWAAE